MTNKTKKTKGSRKSPEKAENEPPSDVDSQPEKLPPGTPPEKLPPEKPPVEEVELSVHVKAMLEGKRFEIKGGKIQHTDGLSAENREIIVGNLIADEDALCRICIARIRQTFASIDLIGPFGQWLTHNHSREVHVHLPLGTYYDLKSPRPMSTLRVRKSNIAMHIREDLKCQIQRVIDNNPEHVVCTDIERLLLMVEEMEITYLPLQERGKTPGNVDRNATPLILDRSSDLSEIFKDHTVYTTMIQLSQEEDGPIAFNEEFVYNFRVDTSCVTMPQSTNGRMDADEISSPRIAGKRSRPPSPELPKRVAFSASEDTIRDMLRTQTSLLKHLNPKTFGDVLGKAVSDALASNLSTPPTGTPLGTAGTVKTARVPGTTSVATRGAPNNLLTVKLGPNESISDFICELSKTTGKIPRLGTWNEKVLPKEVKTRYDAARGLTDFLTSDLIDTAYVYQVDDGTSDPAGAVVPVQHVSRTYWHPCMAGALIDRDGALLQPNFDPDGFLKTATKLQDVRGYNVRAWYKQIRGEASDHGLFMPAYELFHDKTPSNYVTCGDHKDDMLPGHCSAYLARWSACLATLFRKAQTLPDTHPAKKTILSMDNGYAMIIHILRPTHPRYAASCALSMNAPTQDSCMTISDTFDAFKDYKKIQAVYEGSTYNLEGETMIRNFIHNCRDAVYLQNRYDLERNNPSNDHKWKSDQLANSIEAFMTDGGYAIFCRTNGGAKRPPTLPATNPRPSPRVKGGNNNARGTVRGQSNATQGRQGRQLPYRSNTPRPGAQFTSAKLNQITTDMVNNPAAVSYDEMTVCALHQAPSGIVNCNVCNTTHAFYQCPALTDMNEEAQKIYFRTRALEKRQAKKTQYQVDQVYAEDDDADQQDYDDYDLNMDDWTPEHWLGFQNGSFAPYEKQDFR